MLMDDFYTIIDRVKAEDVIGGLVDKPGKRYDFTIKLNPDHPVYGGHFPGNPVVPGVCQVQMIKELTSVILEKDVILSQSDNIKFLSMIRPAETPVLKVSIDIREKETGSWNVTGTISKDEQVFLKFKGLMCLDNMQI
jgi:3-hydroxyacyl-[acyl-carrier-protein] dehydratase